MNRAIQKLDKSEINGKTIRLIEERRGGGDRGRRRFAFTSLLVVNFYDRLHALCHFFLGAQLINLGAQLIDFVLN